MFVRRAFSYRLARVFRCESLEKNILQQSIISMHTKFEL